MGKDDVLKGEDLPFEVPKFNEDEFVRKELISFRTTAILFVWSLLVALITFAYWKYVWDGKDLNAGEFFILVIFCLATGFALPYIYRAFRIDIRHFRRKEWFGTVFMHFLFWLGFTLLLSNPPISDNAAPVVDAYATPSVQGLGGVVTFGAYIGDNEGVDESSLRFCLQERGNQTCDETPWERVPGQPVWIHEWTPTKEGTFDFRIDVKDKNGKASFDNGTVLIGNPFPKISPVGSVTFEDDSRRIAVRPHEALTNVRAVMYRIGDTTYDMVPPAVEGDDWVTDPTYPGWTEGTVNVTFLIQEQPRYLPAPRLNPSNHYKLEGGIAQHAGAARTYTVVSDFQDLNHKKEPDRPENAPPNVAGTPGFGAPLLIGALGVGLALTLRRQRHDRA